ncbi:WXG100 family type VII secretion target [Amycolatopsis sp. cg5]|uniref:WXG100 family type VII secretion target n=1 Tax=Amycolatopsis sp. cg5 TaxID=3238802 RepID=UPI0035266E7F
MADEFRLDPAGVQDTVSKLGGATEDLRDALAKLTSTLDRYEGCWGEDKAGKQFAQGYVSNANSVCDGSKDVATNADNFSSQIKDAVVQFQDLDEENAERFDKQLADSLEDKKDG